MFQESTIPPEKLSQTAIALAEPSLQVSTPVVRCRLELFGQGLTLPLALSVLRRREDHLVNDREPVGLHEHVFRPIEPDPLSPELAGAGRVSRIVGVCPDLETPDLVRPRQEILKLDLAVEIRLDRPDRGREDLSRAPINRDALAPSDHLVADPELRGVVVGL